MKRLLLTGATGFIGRNIREQLEERYLVTAPGRRDLDLRDSVAVAEYIKAGNFDTILHCANPNPVKNGVSDRQDMMFEDSLRIFSNFYHVSRFCGRMFYLGSGAEYDKSRDLHFVSEEEIGERIPYDMYGLSKYCMNEMAKASDNIYNIRIFGCYGPYDHESKFLTHVIRCCLKEEEITVRQDCCFDYMQVTDLARAFIALDDCSKLQYKDYNVCTGKSLSLVDIANRIKKQMGSSCPVRVLKGGMNREYTGSNARFLQQVEAPFDFIDIEEGIALQITHERNNLK